MEWNEISYNILHLYESKNMKTTYKANMKSLRRIESLTMKGGGERKGMSQVPIV